MLVVGNWVLSHLGVARVLRPRLVPLVDGPVGYTISESTRELIAILSTRPKNAEGNARLAAQHQANDAKPRAAGGLGDRPLVVLSSTDMLERMTLWHAGQAKLANLSSRSLHVVANGSHLIAWSHPDLVVSAIQCVLGAAADPARSRSRARRGSHAATLINKERRRSDLQRQSRSRSARARATA